MIQIAGFTQRQGDLATMIWNTESADKVNAIIAQHGVDAIIARDMILAAVFDEITDIDQAEQVLEKFRLQ